MVARGELVTGSALAQKQGERLRRLVEEILPRHRFYADKFAQAGVAREDVRSIEDLARLPFTTKAELCAEQQAHPPYGRLLTYPIDSYSRQHQTSGTTGQPLRWLDTPSSWNWLLTCKEELFQIAGLRTGDRLFFPFSFGPFLGFWTAFEAAWRLGYLVLPGGGMNSAARLRFMLDNRATVVFCTPTYALRLAEVAGQEGIDLAKSPVRALVVAGEPGGSIGATRRRIESAWGARVIDHYGLTEIGPAAIECPENPSGLHVLESHYIAEVIEPATQEPVSPGEMGELVLTNLGRLGSPLIRYRTGDLVRVDPGACPCGRTLLRLEGGVLGRCDDMIHLRGNNVYPGALESVIRRFPEVVEYRVEVDHTGAMPVLRIEIEPTSAKGTELAQAVEHAIGKELLFHAEVKAVAPGSLPRFELKARRVFHKT